MTLKGAYGIFVLLLVFAFNSCSFSDTEGSHGTDGDTPHFEAGDRDKGIDDDGENVEHSELLIVDGDEDKSDGDEFEDESSTDGDENEADHLEDSETSEDETGGEWDFPDLPDPYSKGKYNVGFSVVEKEQSGAPVQFDLYVPEAIQTYPLIVFQHGFTLDASYFSDMLSHIASHGFVVAAPQMYKENSLLGLPKTAEEAASATEFYAWLPNNLESFAGVEIDFTKIGLAGHSRGGKVVWLVLDADRSLASAVAGVDPVDGTGGPFGGEARAIDGPFDFPFPSLVLGSGLGGSCAPTGDNHVQFYEASASPAWHTVATEYGHNDFLNDATPGCLGCGLCSGGPARAPMRKLAAGMLTAFFKHVLTDEEDWDILLDNTQAAPVKVTIESK